MKPDDEVVKNWRPSKATIAEFLPNGTLTPSMVDPVVRSTKPPKVVIEGLDDGPLYRCTVFLKPSGSEATTELAAIPKLSGDERKKVLGQLRAKYLTKAEEAAFDINNNGRISVGLSP